MLYMRKCLRVDRIVSNGICTGHWLNQLRARAHAAGLRWQLDRDVHVVLVLGICIAVPENLKLTQSYNCIAVVQITSIIAYGWIPMEEWLRTDLRCQCVCYFLLQPIWHIQTGCPLMERIGARRLHKKNWLNTRPRRYLFTYTTWCLRATNSSDRASSSKSCGCNGGPLAMSQYSILLFACQVEYRSGCDTAHAANHDMYIQ